MPTVGQKIPISAKLPDTVTDQVVRATVKNASDTEISGSPFTLPHIGLGKYKTEILFPDTEYITIAYEVFKGPGFTNKNTRDYLDAGACFLRDSIDQALKDLKSAVRGFDLVAIINEGEVLVAIVEGDDDLTSVIDDDGTLTGTVDSGEALDATIEQSETLEGDVKC